MADRPIPDALRVLIDRANNPPDAGRDAWGFALVEELRHWAAAFPDAANDAMNRVAGAMIAGDALKPAAGVSAVMSGAVTAPAGAAPADPADLSEVIGRMAADPAMTRSGFTTDVLARMAPVAVLDMARQAGLDGPKARKRRGRPSLLERVSRRAERIREREAENEELVRQGLRKPPKRKPSPDEEDVGLTNEPPAGGVPNWKGVRTTGSTPYVDALLVQDEERLRTHRDPNAGALGRVLGDLAGRTAAQAFGGTRLGRVAFRAFNTLPPPVRNYLGRQAVRGVRRAVGPRTLRRLGLAGGRVRAARTLGGRAAGLGRAGIGRAAGALAARGAAAGAAGAAGGAGAGAAGLAAAGGPAGVAAASVMALAVAATEAAKQAVDFGYSMERTNRKVADFSPSQDAIWSKLDAERVFRDSAKGENTAGTADVLANSLNKLEETFAPLDTTLTNLSNLVAAVGVEVVTDFTAVLSGAIEVLKQIPAVARYLDNQSTAEADDLSAVGLLNKFAAQHEADLKRREAMRGAVRAVHERQ